MTLTHFFPEGSTSYSDASVTNKSQIGKLDTRGLLHYRKISILYELFPLTAFEKKTYCEAQVAYYWDMKVSYTVVIQGD